RDFDCKPSPNAAPVERMTVSVDGAGGHELVSLRMNDGSLSWSCTCGLPRCEHVQAALSALSEPRQGSSVPPPPRSSEPPPAPAPGRTASSDRHEIAL